MLNGSPPAAPDLLVIGGLAIDRFDDGREEAGGSVVHISRAFAARGRPLWVLTAAGPEPTARRGIRELSAAGHLFAAVEVQRTVVFHHREEFGSRRLWLERAAQPLPIARPLSATMPTVPVLYAPVAGELVPPAEAPPINGSRAGACLQGWLRRLEEGREVEPLGLDELADDLVAWLGGLDLLVASIEDLGAENQDPRDALQAVRARFGPRPALALTGGAEGVWAAGSELGGRRRAWHSPVPRPVHDVPTVGAGDVFAADLLAGGVDARRLQRSVDAAMRSVIALLEARRRH